MQLLCSVRFALLLLLALTAFEPAVAMLPEFQASPWFHEQTRWETTPDGVRVFANAPASVDPAKPTLVVFYATPNGNTIEQTLGCKAAKGLDWHYDIQHIAAQMRKLRDLDQRTNIALVVVQPQVPDEYFTASQRDRLADLMSRWQGHRDAGQSLPPKEQTELEELVKAEVKAATDRAAALIRRLRP